MAVAPTDVRRWMTEGTARFTAASAALTEQEYAVPSALPGWSRKHVVAHVAANAEALGNLVHWAATGEETPMYPSREERDAGIERGALLAGEELTAWLRRSADALEQAMAALTEEQWQHEVRTSRGRAVPAAETPWMRAREVWIHAVDLGVGLGFADPPTDFNTALVDDIGSQRGLAELPAEVADAPVAEVAAWLAGRPHSLTDAPELGPWL